MKNFLLNIWSWPIDKRDRYDISEPEEFSEDQHREWIRETKRQYEEDLKARKNRDAEFVWCLVGNIIGERPVGEIKRERNISHLGQKCIAFHLSGGRL
jgi:hypothetical protein